MALSAGDRLPAATFRTMTADGVKELSTDDVFKGRKVLLFAVVGAFSPTCHKDHLPGYVSRHDEIKATGIDTIACLSVNDAHVLDAWAGQSQAHGKVLMLSDGNGDFTRSVGMELDATRFGEGLRSHRYAALVDDGVVQDIQVESNPGAVSVSGATEMCRR
jgi:glutaredoxin/glutathione-dependent peroxiredoxin